MDVVFQFMESQREVIEQFMGNVHVVETRDVCLNEALVSIFSIYGLSISSFKGHGYDGVCAFNGLKSLILRENPNAHYNHCFSH